MGADSDMNAKMWELAKLAGDQANYAGDHTGGDGDVGDDDDDDDNDDDDDDYDDEANQ